eukprot:scaffold38448_cov42-Phaeocystis_antarctica.AAC.1
MDLETALAVTQETPRNVAESGTGERVKTTTAAGTCCRISVTMARRFWRFSCTELTRKPCRVGSK